MDRSTAFLEDMINARSLSFVEGGVLVVESGAIWFCEDLDGDLRAHVQNRYSELHLSKEQIIAMLHQGGPFWRLITALVDSGCSHTLVFDSLNDIVGEMGSSLKFSQAFGDNITTADRHGTIFCEGHEVENHRPIFRFAAQPTQSGGQNTTMVEMQSPPQNRLRSRLPLGVLVD